MKEIISKELLSEVLDDSLIDGEIEVVDNAVFFDETDMMGKYFTTNAKYDKTINIHELVHKCKEWAFNKAFIVTSFKYGDKENKTQWFAETDEYRFRRDTEPEAIFKACQWILDNKEQVSCRCGNNTREDATCLQCGEFARKREEQK